MLDSLVNHVVCVTGAHRLISDFVSDTTIVSHDAVNESSILGPLVLIIFALLCLNGFAGCLYLAALFLTATLLLLGFFFLTEVLGRNFTVLSYLNLASKVHTKYLLALVTVVLKVLKRRHQSVSGLDTKLLNPVNVRHHSTNFVALMVNSNSSAIYLRNLALHTNVSVNFGAHSGFLLSSM